MVPDEGTGNCEIVAPWVKRILSASKYVGQVKEYVQSIMPYPSWTCSHATQSTLPKYLAQIQSKPTKDGSKATMPGKLVQRQNASLTLPILKQKLKIVCP